MKRKYFFEITLLSIILIIVFTACELGGLIEAPAYTVVYDSNGGTGSMADSTHVYGVYKSLSANQFTHATLDFAGWAESPGADVQFSDKERVKNLTDKAGGRVTLYAQWGYTLSYDGNGATSGTPPASQTVKPGKTVVINGPGTLRKVDEMFIRWDTASGGTGTSYTAGSSITLTGGNVKIYAQWDLMSPVNVYAETDNNPSIGIQLNWVEQNAVSDSLYVLTAGKSEDLSGRVLSYSGKSNIVIRLRGADSEQTLTLAAAGPMFTVGAGVTLSLYENITLKGRGTANTGDSLVKVNSGGSLVMKAGSGIKDNTNSASGFRYGGGVYVADGASFAMEGGIISGNSVGGLLVIANGRGGGVFVGGAGASFTMDGGTISGNKSIGHGGGVYAADGASFTMKGGTISGNKASGPPALIGGEPVIGHGGGVYVYSAVFTKTGGTITGYASYVSGDASSFNVVTDVLNNPGGNDSGHAVYSTGNGVTKRQEKTAGTGVDLSFDGNTGVFGGGWDY